jgi:hypothetical protein
VQALRSRRASHQLYYTSYEVRRTVARTCTCVRDFHSRPYSNARANCHIPPHPWRRGVRADIAVRHYPFPFSQRSRTYMTIICLTNAVLGRLHTACLTPTKRTRTVHLHAQRLQRFQHWVSKHQGRTADILHCQVTWRGHPPTIFTTPPPIFIRKRVRQSRRSRMPGS